MVTLFTEKNFPTDYIYFIYIYTYILHQFKMLLIYLKKEMSLTVCVYFFYFTWGREKLIFGAGGEWKSYSKIGGDEKVIEARGLQKVTEVGGQDEKK